MGLSRQEAAERLKAGDIGFILEAQIPAQFSSALSTVKKLNRIHPSASFYAGLLVKSEDSGRAALLFAAALESPSLPVRREAAMELMFPALRDAGLDTVRGILALTKKNSGREGASPALRAACLYRLGKFSDIEKLYRTVTGLSPWDNVLSRLARLNSKNPRRPLNPGRPLPLNEDFIQLKAFLFSSASDGIRDWALEEFLRIDPEGLGPAERAALAGKSAAARSDFVRGTERFREVLEQEPELFFQNPELIHDLGRCFQFNPPAREEGAALFASWDSLLESPEAESALRYRVLYFAGRIERQREEYTRSSEFFRRAMEIAPDPLQSDACLWYILINAMTAQPETAAALVNASMPAMSQAAYFSDVLDKLSRYLSSRRQWKTMLEVFSRLRAQGTNGAMIAQYAWILGRAVQEGFLPASEALPGERGGAGEPAHAVARALFTIAFEESGASLYYRVMSASKLGAALTPASAEPPASAGPPASAEPPASADMEFLLAFFELGAAGRAYPYILDLEKSLSVSELRSLAEALANAGRRDESLNLVSRYMAREGYEINSEDLLLYYPQPFRELIEDKAREAGLGPEMLFGLIRTESYFMPGAVSRSGAVGLSQLMEPTALEMAGRIARLGGPDYRLTETPGSSSGAEGGASSGAEGGALALDLTDPETNVHIGAFYVRYLVDRMGSPMLALLAYNGGMGRVRRWHAGQKPWLPDDLFLETIEFDETREYGRRVLAAAAVYGYLYYGLSMEAVVADVYSTGP
jgi:soluble lytic murein transglycosylase